MTPERVVDVRTRTILRVLGVTIFVAVVLEVIWISRQVVSWLLISLFLALALDPFVSWIERRARRGRRSASPTS